MITHDLSCQLNRPDRANKDDFDISFGWTELWLQAYYEKLVRWRHPAGYSVYLGRPTQTARRDSSAEGLDARKDLVL
jgi:hypothetical protein